MQLMLCMMDQDDGTKGVCVISLFVTCELGILGVT